MLKTYDLNLLNIIQSLKEILEMYNYEEVGFTIKKNSNDVLLNCTIRTDIFKTYASFSMILHNGKEIFSSLEEKQQQVHTTFDFFKNVEKSFDMINEAELRIKERFGDLITYLPTKILDTLINIEVEKVHEKCKSLKVLKNVIKPDLKLIQ